MGIGLGFQVSPAVGVMVAVAVISHDFTDGMNTVALMLSHHNPEPKARAFLFLDACAPVLGAISTLFFVPSPYVLFLYLGVFAGFLLYIGASDILPEAHSRKSSYRLVALTAFGMVFAFFAAKFAGG
jgi:ZIP family zinc transporter